MFEFTYMLKEFHIYFILIVAVVAVDWYATVVTNALVLYVYTCVHIIDICKVNSYYVCMNIYLF